MLILQNTSSGDESSQLDPFIDDMELAQIKANKAIGIKVSIQFWVVVALNTLTFFLRSYREDVCNNFQDDPINGKLEEIKQRYAISKLKQEN